MSGRAASRECRNAGNRPASWNGRTGWASAACSWATAGAPGGKVCQDANARTEGFELVCNVRASASNHLCLGVKTYGPRKSISDLDGALRQP